MPQNIHFKGSPGGNRQGIIDHGIVELKVMHEVWNSKNSKCHLELLHLEISRISTYVSRQENRGQKCDILKKIQKGRRTAISYGLEDNHFRFNIHNGQSWKYKFDDNTATNIPCGSCLARICDQQEISQILSSTHCFPFKCVLLNVAMFKLDRLEKEHIKIAFFKQ